VVDFRRPRSDDYYASLTPARDAFASVLRDYRHGTRPRLTATGHAHIDVAWLWPLAQTRRKAARTFATVLRLMEQYPEYHFTQSQPQLYQFVKEDEPALYEQIKTRVAEGRWELTGAMWLEPDTNVPNGESLARQIIYGQRFFEREFGRRTAVVWLPDVFGYSAALPQIMRAAGIERFMTSKISSSFR
jgi:alpha-mannosidase